ncbi:type II toxin-antitoxin system ParD family antitoxin (plasmid) [Rhizobium sp. CB3171]|uniref:type II toxin-antitoxin system ParD family antitoxin n=1 Tax=Rhizobium sp. CB3171 TaxID=3039157 RepID=UPI0024B0A4E0|nr:type II toxin-antitoxin system ParD family antitoxin [Rhizobium sp. CB3171]WFU07554.1 type II toxin-antitoxin system ParD family antitoxin [Rhizobium sp. CB3171]
MRANKSISLTLGKQQQVLDQMVASGDYDSHSEAARAAVRALARERDAIDAVWKEKIREALEDPRPSVPAKKVFADLRAHHEAQIKAEKRGA